MNRRKLLQLASVSLLGPLSASTLFAGELDLKKMGIVTVKSNNHSKVFTLGKNAFLLSEDSEVEIHADPDNLILNSIRLISGAVHGVFEPNSNHKRELITPDAIVGIRGTAVYARYEPENDRTYCCLCYGKVHMQCSNTNTSQLLNAGYHTPRIIDKQGISVATNVPMLHNDEDLVMLEASVGREPHWTKPTSSPKM